MRDIQRDLPFKVSELKKVSNHDNTYSFRSDEYISLLPDYEVDSEGASMIYQTTFTPTHHTQPSSVIWRNIVINRKAKRVLCIDRLDIIVMQQDMLSEFQISEGTQIDAELIIFLHIPVDTENSYTAVVVQD